ncbi:hypothetical protein AB0M12_05200 [Nocardia vinacea]|uniref:hypothetical protein n=1 Tax=Nocardia vinacea TaxID=96468 RepID=UPI0034155AE4
MLPAVSMILMPLSMIACTYSAYDNTSAEPTTTVRHTGSASAGAIPLRHNGAHQRAGSDHAAVVILRSWGDTAAFQTPMEASAGVFDEGDAGPIRLADQRF